MNQKPPAVQVVKVNADGIRAKIYGKDYAWNKAKNQFFIESNGKWAAAEIPAFQQSMLKDRHSAYLLKQRRQAFSDDNPLYVNTRERHARATQRSNHINANSMLNPAIAQGR